MYCKSYTFPNKPRTRPAVAGDIRPLLSTNKRVVETARAPAIRSSLMTIQRTPTSNKNKDIEAVSPARKHLKIWGDWL